MLPMANMETVIFYVYNFYTHGCNVFMCTTFIPIGAMYLHARTFFTLTDNTSIPMGAMYLHARMFCTLAHTSSIPMGAMYLQM